MRPDSFDASAGRRPDVRGYEPFLGANVGGGAGRHARDARRGKGAGGEEEGAGMGDVRGMGGRELVEALVALRRRAGELAKENAELARDTALIARDTSLVRQRHVP